MGYDEVVSLVSATRGIAPGRSLSALLSQVLVAFTVEFDNEFERQMGEAGYRGARLSLVVWANVVRFVGEGAVSVRDLTARALARDTQMKFELGCLEGAEEFSPRITRGRGRLPLPTLLSQLLLTFRLEFDRESPAPLTLCANTLRALGEKPIRVVEIPGLTGGSPETSDIGWQIKPYVVVEPDPAASRGKVAHLSPRGLGAQHTYHRLIGQIEKRWEARFGKEKIGRLRESLQGLFDRRGGDSSLLSEGLVPPPGTVRAGDQAPALGRRDVGAAARKRMRDLVAQTEAFVRDPAGTLPHYPLGDMNRGFGP
ncbi:MAG: hypothetical protein ACLQVM_19440 [Terriglobia bacterium]